MNIRRVNYKQIAILQLMFMVLIYIFKLYIPKIQNLDYTIISTVLWGIYLSIYYFKIPKKHSNEKFNSQKEIIIWACCIAAFTIIIQMVMGMIVGFGKNPASQSLKGILYNTFTVSITLVGQEMVRNYSVRNLKERHIYIGYIGIALLFSIMELSIVRIIQVNSLETLVITLSRDVLPIILKNMLATMLVLYGGTGASIVYLGMLEAFGWYCPILPNLNWLISGVLGIAIPSIAMSSLYEKHSMMTGQLKQHAIKKGELIKDSIAGVFIIVAIWFVVGVFPYYPSAILTGSMEPGIMPGDVVIVDKIESMEEINQLKEGDVIQFKRDELLINHRIIEVINENGKKYYCTKGDNNNMPDEERVEVEDIKGIITMVIPKVGLPTIWLKGSRATDYSQ